MIGGQALNKETYLSVLRARLNYWVSHYPWLGALGGVSGLLAIGLVLDSDRSQDFYFYLCSLCASLLGFMGGALCVDAYAAHRARRLNPSSNPELSYWIALERSVEAQTRASERLSEVVSQQLASLKALELCAEGFSFSYTVSPSGLIDIQSVGDNLVRFVNLQRAEFLSNWAQFMRFVDPMEQDMVRKVITRTDAFPERERIVFGLTKAAHEEKRYYQLSLLRRQQEGGMLFVYALLLDVSDYVLARLKAESDDKAKSDFLATVSHELRTPLNAIVGFSSLLETNLSDPENKADAHNVVMAGESLHRILNDILDYSRIEAHGIKLETKAFDLNEVLSHIYQLNRTVAIGKGVELSYINELQDSPSFLGDAHRLRQVVQNLVSNSLKFTEQGFVKIRVSGSRPVHSRMEVFIEVIDSGIGISQVELGKLFKRFSQAGRDISRRFGGTGLGLAISKGLVELMGGRIDVSSEPGVGSVFTVSLNLGVSHTPSLQGPSAPRPSDVKLGILIVDDHPLNLKLLDKFLSKRGHTVVKAFGGQQAIESAASQRFDLILMDIDMPEMDGHEASKRIRAGQGLSQGSYICALSGLSDEVSVQVSKSCGMNQHLSKPVSFDALDLVLNEVANLSAS